MIKVPAAPDTERTATMARKVTDTTEVQDRATAAEVKPVTRQSLEDKLVRAVDGSMDWSTWAQVATTVFSTDAVGFSARVDPTARGGGLALTVWTGPHQEPYLTSRLHGMDVPEPGPAARAAALTERVLLMRTLLAGR